MKKASQRRRSYQNILRKRKQKSERLGVLSVVCGAALVEEIARRRSQNQKMACLLAGPDTLVDEAWR